MTSYNVNDDEIAGRLSAEEMAKLIEKLRNNDNVARSPSDRAVLAIHCLRALDLSVHDLIKFAFVNGAIFAFDNDGVEPLVPHIDVLDVRCSASLLRRDHPEIDLDDRVAVELVLDNPYQNYPPQSERFVTWCIATVRETAADEDDVYFVPDEPGHEGQATRWRSDISDATETDRPSWQRSATPRAPYRASVSSRRYGR